MSSTCRACAAILAGGTLLLGGGCSSGGGGGGPAPVIVTAAFVGTGPGPAVGDLLIITVSRPSTLQAEAALDDLDFTISGGGTLGSVTSAPVALSSQSVQITLGAGVAFTPGSTTIVFGEQQDAIRATDGAIGRGGAGIVITAGDGNAPTLTNLTLSGVDDQLNGEGAAGGTLQVGRNGFTIDLTHTDPSNPIDTSQTFLTSNRAISVDGTERPPGQNLAEAFTLTTGSGTSSFLVPANVTFPDGEQTLSGFVTDVTGMSSAAVSFSFRVRFRDNNVRPFESSQVWFLDLSRDIEAIATDLLLTPGANGTPDFDELLIATGLYSSGSPTNATVLGELHSRILDDLGTLFSGVNISFTFTSPGVFPSGQSSVPFNSGSFSQICIAGSATDSASQILGSALFNPNNTTHEDNCQTAFGQSSVRLGVFPHAALLLGFNSGAASDFRQTYDPLAPVRGNQPIGSNGGDAARLAEVVAGTNTGNDPRITLIDGAIRKMARLVAVVTAHECGHSMGLVANGAMPAGLFGNDAANFPLSGNQPASNADGHIQNTSLFPSGAQNVMSPAINFDAAQSPATIFNTLNLAYLRERAVYVPN